MVDKREEVKVTVKGDQPMNKIMKKFWEKVGLNKRIIYHEKLYKYVVNCNSQRVN